jgi:hypothetical protein
VTLQEEAPLDDAVHLRANRVTLTTELPGRTASYLVAQDP